MATTFEIRSKIDGSLAGTADTMTAADRLLLHLQRTYLEPYWIQQVTSTEGQKQRPQPQMFVKNRGFPI